VNEKEFRRGLERELEVGLAAVPLPAVLPERARYRAGPTPSLGPRLWVAVLVAAAGLALMGGLGTAAAGWTGPAALASELAWAFGLRHAPQTPIHPADPPALGPPAGAGEGVLPPPVSAPAPADLPGGVVPAPRQLGDPERETDRPERPEPAEPPERRQPAEPPERPSSEAPERQAPEASPPRGEQPERD
jgi:hypothetical protein